ncbi:hypothetical protein Tco_1063062 [Tanacetum coccineum]
MQQIALPNFASAFQFNNRATTLEKEVVELKKDPLYTQVTALVDDHLDARLGETREEFMNFLSASLTARITEQVQNQLPQILPKASEEPEFEVADLDMPQDQEENLGKDDEEPKEKVASKRDWFTKPTQPQEPTDLDWNIDKTP